MANVSKINGFNPVKHLNGSPYNGQATMYAHSSGDSTALFVGDVVKLSGSANTSGIQYVTAATAGSAGTGAAAVGVVVGVVVGVGVGVGVVVGHGPLVNKFDEMSGQSELQG